MVFIFTRDNNVDEKCRSVKCQALNAALCKCCRERERERENALIRGKMAAVIKLVYRLDHLYTCNVVERKNV